MKKTKFKFLVDGISYLDNLERNIIIARQQLEDDGFEEVAYTVNIGVSNVIFTIEYQEKPVSPREEEFIDPNQTVIDCDVEEIAKKPKRRK